MIRNIDLEQISDGKLYKANDLVKADCHDCPGCSDCCRGMGESIVLDPYDVWRLCSALGLTFPQLLEEHLELHVVDGLILPNLRMAGPEEACTFLSEAGRCTIHDARPGFCRLFPLGRIYEEHSFSYFLQVHECKSSNRSKIKVKNWIDTPDFKRYESFILEWHFSLKPLQEWLLSGPDDALARKVNLYMLQTFFYEPYDTDADFYAQFGARLARAKQDLLGAL